jgi:carboxylesterase
MLVKTTEPFYFPGNETGCLLIHGFTGAPTEMRPLGEFLAEKGYSVLGVRLTGHGTRIEDMDRVVWQDWSNSVLDGWHLLRPNTSRVFIVGLSMGGVLALYHASFLPVEGVISLSAPYEMEPDPRLKFLPLFSKIIPYASKGKSDWQDPHANEEHFSYDMYPTKAILQLTQLLEAMRASLPAITSPALLVHSKKDIGVPHHNMEKISRALGTPEEKIQKLLLENSGHVVTRDLEKDLVFRTAHEFIQNVLESRS